MKLILLQKKQIFVVVILLFLFISNSQCSKHKTKFNTKSRKHLLKAKINSSIKNKQINLEQYYDLSGNKNNENNVSNEFSMFRPENKNVIYNINKKDRDNSSLLSTLSMFKQIGYGNKYRSNDTNNRKIREDDKKVDYNAGNIIGHYFERKVDPKYMPSPNSTSKKESTDKKQMQSNAFPNTYLPPTMSENLDNQETEFKKPLLSRALFETDQNRKLKKREFLESIQYPLYNLSRGEMQVIFDFCDVNKDDLVEGREWDAFVALFILPFEACDSNDDYFIDLNEWKTCFSNDPRAKMIKLRNRYQDKAHEVILNLVASRRDMGLNVSNYLMLRRAIYGWTHCETNTLYISVKDFKCAMQNAIPSKFHLKIDMERVYNAGLKLANDDFLYQLDFVAYIQIIYNTFVFSIFSFPSDLPVIEKTDFIKSVNENRWPNHFSEAEVNIFYELTANNPIESQNLLSFESFVFFYNIHRLFTYYATTRPNMLSREEALLMLDDKVLPTKISIAIDLSLTEFTEEEYQEGSLVLQRYRLNEQDFYSFMETDASTNETKFLSASKKERESLFMNRDLFENNLYYKQKKKTPPKKPDNDGDNKIPPSDDEPKSNIKNRLIFFSILTGNDKDYWTREAVYRGFQICNLFTELIKFNRRFIVSNSVILDNLMRVYDEVSPPISMKGRENYQIYKSIPRETYLDILVFLSLEYRLPKIESVKESNDRFINETLVKTILKDYGMINMPDPVIDLAKKGFDKLHRRIYDPEDVIKYCSIVQIVSAENKRTIYLADEYKLNVNTDVTRKYPNFSRRFMSSPLV